MTDAELRDEVEGWLRTHLPADWVAAIDAGDDDALAAARGQVRYEGPSSAAC